MKHEYKMEPARRQPDRIRGVRSPHERLATGLTEQLNAAALDGWEYVRTDSFPVEYRSGLFRAKVVEVAAFLVFRRPAVFESPVRHDVGHPRVDPDENGHPPMTGQPEPGLRPVPPVTLRHPSEEDDAFRAPPPVGRP